MTQIFVDHQLLTKLAGAMPQKPVDSEDYLAFLQKVREAVLQLPPNHSKVIAAYYFECRVIKEIAVELGLSEADIKCILREGLLKLKHTLIPEVKTRWPNRFGHLRDCPICSHPDRDNIEAIIKAKKHSESWGAINKKLKFKFGVSFNPPSVIISHMKYHNNENEEI